MNAVKRVVRKLLVDHAVARLRKRTDAYENVEHWCGTPERVVTFADERVNIRQVGLRIELDQRSVAVA